MKLVIVISMVLLAALVSLTATAQTESRFQEFQEFEEVSLQSQEDREQWSSQDETASFLERALQRTGKTSGLSCTCVGGPGNYPYACAPVVKTCYGGPGNYPYNCSVCP